MTIAQRRTYSNKATVLHSEDESDSNSNSNNGLQSTDAQQRSKTQDEQQTSHPSSSTPSSAHSLPNHPIQPFFLPQSIFHQVLLFPRQLVFAIAGFLGLAHYARQIVRVVPRRPGVVRLAGSSTPTLIEGINPRREDVRVDKWIEENVKCLEGSFRPSWWLPNGHFQTIYSVLGNFNKVDQVTYDRTYLRTGDGGTIALDFSPPHHHNLDPSTPTIVLCHGLTGGSHESYVRNVVAWAVKPVEEGGLGARAVVVNFRGCAGTPVTSPRLYSAGTTIDLSLSLHYLRHILPISPLHGIGFSLGASVLSRYLGESGQSTLLSSGIVLGCPWDLTAMSDKLENDFVTRTIYSAAMAQNLLRLFFNHYDRDPRVFDGEESHIKPFISRLQDMKRGKRGVKVTLKRVDDIMVSKIGGPAKERMWPFRDADEYYKWACPKEWMWNVKRPLLSINAFDDPIIDGSALPLVEFQASTHVYEAITGGGGHLGWFDGPFWSAKGSKCRWVLRPIQEWFRGCVRDLEVEGAQVEVEVDDVAEEEESRVGLLEGKERVAKVEGAGEEREDGWVEVDPSPALSQADERNGVSGRQGQNGIESSASTPQEPAQPHAQAQAKAGGRGSTRWVTVTANAHPVVGLDPDERLKWKVLSKEEVDGAGESGVMQGL